jgi:hypothetical protein
MPFPFVFKLILSSSDFFAVPDALAAVYIEGKKDYSYSIDNLVCQFNTTFASNSTITVISDYCLRLCVDVLDSNKTSLITPVWTNIPVGNYLSSGSDSVLLSNDGTTFTRILKLTGTKLYLKGITGPTAVYGENSIDVTIKLVTSEAIDEYTV